MMALDEMKLAVCGRLPELIKINHENNCCWLKELRPVNWPTEGLQVCHEAEKLLTADEWDKYETLLPLRSPQHAHATYEQRLEALCRVWWPERF